METTQESTAPVEQASAEDRATDLLFGDDTPEAIESAPAVPEGDDDGEVSDEPPVESDELEASDDEPLEFVDIEYDGKLYEVPPELKDALLRQQDYTQKTQQTASEKKEVEVLRGEVEQRRQQYEFAQSVQEEVRKAEQLDSAAKQYREYLGQNIDSLSSGEIEKIRFAIETANQERDTLVSQLTNKTNEFQHAQQQSFQELLKKGTEVLSQRIPNWGQAQQKAVRDYALQSGFTEQELQTVADPRQVETLWKAAQYDALQKGKGAAVKRVESAPKIKPKSRNPMPDNVKRDLNRRKQLKSGNLSRDQKHSLIGDAVGDMLGL